MRPTLVTASGLAVGLVVLALARAPGRGEALAFGDHPALVLGQVPVGRATGEGGGAAAGSLDRRYPPGSRVVLVHTRGAVGREVVETLSRGLEAAGCPDVSSNARSVVFAGRRDSAAPWRIYGADLEGGRPRRIVEAAGDCGDPAHLAGGRLVFVVFPDPPDVPYLATADLEGGGRGGAVERITFGPSAAGDPTPLADGRVLFCMSIPGDHPAGVEEEGEEEEARVGLFTINPDGTLLEPFSGIHGAPARVARPRQTADGGVLFLRAEPPGARSALERVELRDPRGTRTPLHPFLAGGDGPLALAVASAEPLPDAGLVLTAQVEGAGAGAGVVEGRGIFRWSAGSPATPLLHTPGWDSVEVVPLLVGCPPRGRPSAVVDGASTAILVGYDAGRSDARFGPGRGAPPPATLAVETLTAAGPLELGRVPLEPDGSFHLQVPADRPLRVQTLDGALEPIATSAWFWVRPGEVRACFGCHESRDTAPVNRPVQAIARPARILGQEAEEVVR